MNEQYFVLAGYYIAKGFCRWVSKSLLMTFIVVFVLSTLWNAVRLITGVGLDDSDLSSRKRSNMEVYTDYKTGVQYIGSRNGLSVRVDKDGRPIVIDIGDK